MSRFRVLAVAVALSVSFVVLTGCASRRSDKVTATEVQWHMSPELFSVGKTYGQHMNMHARSASHTARQIWDDGSKFWLLTEPSHLTEYPVP